MLKVVTRSVPLEAEQQLMAQGYNPLMAKVYAARGIADSQELNYQMKHLLPYQDMKNIQVMAKRLTEAITHQKKLLVVADYDADGATACALAVKGLRLFGAKVEFIVPDRFTFGYGLTPEFVDYVVAERQPDILLTVDNGIASVDAVKAAKRYGIEVLITDHHLPGSVLPDALIVNPNQPGCSFSSKYLCGAGVMFYVLLALRAYWREQGCYLHHTEPNLAHLLDLVALGTVADLVPLDRNNRILVENGLRRMRTGKMSPGIRALFTVAGRASQKASTFDLGFALGPRINAAGRLDDMAIGITCLLATQEVEALHYAQQLDNLNRERRTIEHTIQEEALSNLATLQPEGQYTLCLFREDWHQGVVGIVASRLKEQFYRPVIVFAPGNEGEIRGSGRSIKGFHLRDALDLVFKRHPGLIQRFGGHAMAAGLTIQASRLTEFTEAFERVAQQMLSKEHLERLIETDGGLEAHTLTLDMAQQLASEVWGQGFPPPCFSDTFTVQEQKIVGGKHLKLSLMKEGRLFNAMLFNHAEWLPIAIHAVYQMVANEWRDQYELQIYIQHWETSE